jgi:hypothetical protein
VKWGEARDGKEVSKRSRSSLGLGREHSGWESTERREGKGRTFEEKFRHRNREEMDGKGGKDDQGAFPSSR